MQPDAIAQALEGMSKTEEGKKQVQQLMTQFQQEMQGGQAQSAKRGGKIQDFICKHARGGQVAGCGCGGSVEKHQQTDGKGRGTIGTGLSSGNFKVPFLPYVKTYLSKKRTPNVGPATNRFFGHVTSNGNEYYLEDADIGGHQVDTWVMVGPRKDTTIKQVLPSGNINDLDKSQVEAVMQRFRPDIARVNSKENGGKVIKGQDGLGKLYAGWDSNDMFVDVPNAKYHFKRDSYPEDYPLKDQAGHTFDTIAGKDDTYAGRDIYQGDTTYYPNRSIFMNKLRSNQTFGINRDNWITLDKERIKLRK